MEEHNQATSFSRDREGLTSQTTLNDRQKVKVERVDSLFLLTYCDAASQDEAESSKMKVRRFNVSLYIDIPTIDYYNDELRHFKLSKINKKFKIHKMRDLILSTIAENNRALWDLVTRSVPDAEKRPVTFELSVSSSGALRYVETIRFLVDRCWEKFRGNNKVRVTFKIQVTPTSLIWFKTFFDKELLDSSVLNFELIGNYNLVSSSTTPFKEYYTKLNEKFTSKAHSANGDSIIIITNNTGVKALLTILSDKPLTSVLSQASLDALHNNALPEKHRALEAVNTDSEDDRPLKRESSSLLSFQNSLLTSNKDKSVKVRSFLLSRKSPSLSTNGGNMAYGTGGDEATPNDYEEDDDDDGDVEDEGGGDDDGLSFSVPSRLSRCGSDTDFSAESVRAGDTTRRRFRSLSLMDPALNVPFSREVRSPTPDDCPYGDNGNVNAGIKMRDDGEYANIYVHDGQFEGTISTAPRKSKKLFWPGKDQVSNGLIPPEFYSRISSPSSSNSSSRTSLENINILPGTFSKLLESGNELASSKDKLAAGDLVNSLLERPKGNFLALHFRSNKVIPPEAQALDQEDMLMSGTRVDDEFGQEGTSVLGSGSTSTLTARAGGRSSMALSAGTINLDLQVYDDNDEHDGKPAESAGSHPSDSIAKPTENTSYRKPKFTLDLYNDNDLESNGAWLLGANSRLL
ncbi:LAMI_0H18536g1_1 [Lachancea mirantina]|uniref:LAMI_0H18536g1_1 n=1 Tax=Lachancea mirantina TaxID=1230905 RepID=A0A1G4KJN0_9SACH|nr:LAMI_0H18536g1_1 [Lachancea mirantina]